MCRRYVAVAADIFEHPLFDGEEFSRRDAWLWLVANAAWKDHRVRIGNAMVDIKRAQVVAARSHLAKEWRWGEKKVRLFLDLLASEGMIERGQKEGRLPIVITICNYDRFQTGKAIEGQKEGQQRADKGPTEGQIGAGKGPHSTKDTKDTNTTTISSASSTARDDCAAPKVDLDRLMKACNGALDNPANCMGLLTSATPIMWLESGCDLERDVLPTLEAAGKKHHGKRIRSWDYFTGAVTEARDRRMRGLPPVQSKKSNSEPTPAYLMPTRTRERSEDELMAIAIEQLRADGISV